MYVSHAVNLEELNTYMPFKVKLGKFPADSTTLHLLQTLHRVLPGESSINCCEIGSGAFYRVLSTLSEPPPCPNTALSIIFEKFTRCFFYVEFIGAHLYSSLSAQASVVAPRVVDLFIYTSFPLVNCEPPGGGCAFSPLQP